MENINEYSQKLLSYKGKRVGIYSSDKIYGENIY